MDPQLPIVAPAIWSLSSSYLSTWQNMHEPTETPHMFCCSSEYQTSFRTRHWWSESLTLSLGDGILSQLTSGAGGLSRSNPGNVCAKFPLAVGDFNPDVSAYEARAKEAEFES
jgi:hypothetical protein